jgi:MFS family permease
MRRVGPALGLLLMCGSLVGSSFATAVPTLIGSQGALYGIGCSLVYTPTILYMDEWFVARKGLAFGILSAGSGLGGVVLPFTINAAFAAFSFRTVLRAYAGALLVLLGPALWFVRPRLPPTATRRFDLTFLRTPAFLLFGLGNVLQSLGFFIPSVYLPTYAKFLGGSNSVGTVSLVLFNVASVAGCVLMGLLVDRLSVTTCIAISALGSAVSVFLFWGFSNELSLLLVFSLLYGLFAGSFSSTWPGIMRSIVSKTARTEPTMVFAFLAAGRGVGNVVSGPISDILIKAPNWQGEALLGYGSKYGPLIVFTGATALMGGIAVSGRRILV